MLRPVFLFFFCFIVSFASAQQPADTARFSFDFRGRPLQEALVAAAIAMQTGIGYNTELVEGMQTQCVIENAAPREVVRCLVAGTGLSARRQESGSYRLYRAEVREGRAQSARYTISGYVRDRRSGEALIQAAVYDRTRERGVTTNAYGFYSLTLPAGETSLVVSYLGYERAGFNFDLQESRTLNIELTPVSYGIDTLEVVGERLAPIETRTSMSAATVPIEQIQRLPALLGEPDVLRTVQLLPGIQSGNEGTAGLYVRGGGIDQNLFLLDGATVYNPYHLFGFLSIFNARALKDVTVIKGGFPARYGGRLSSVVDISMRDGNMKTYTADATIGIAASSLTLEGPIVSDRTSFIVSVRRSLLDLFLTTVSTNEDVPAYALLDFNGKLNHRISDSDRLYASVYRGNDGYRQLNRFDGEEGGDARNRFEIDWGNTVGTVRWNHLFSNKLFSNTTALYSRYRLETEQEDVRYIRYGEELRGERYRLLYASGIEDIGLKIDFDYAPSPEHTIRFGASATHHLFTTGAFHVNEGPVDTPGQDTLVVPVSDLPTFETSAYLEDDVQLGRRLSVNAGLHTSLYRVESETYTSLQPRVSARLMLPFGLALKASYAYMTQYIHLLVNSGLGLPTDLWLPATRRVRHQQAEQIAVGLARSFGDAYEVSIESYTKSMRGLIEYKEGANYLGASEDWQKNVETGEGSSYGIEFFLHKKRGRTTGWIGYTLSRSNRRFERLNRGERFPFRYDRRHDVALAMVHRLSDRVSISANWLYGTGHAVTISTARFSPVVIGDLSNRISLSSPNYEIQRIGPRNGYRMPAYHRLDLAVNVEWPARREGRHHLTAGVYNAYNRHNAYFLFIVQDDVPSTDPSSFETEFNLRQASLFPILPSLSYGFTF